VAFLAGCVQVRAGEWIARLRVVELLLVDTGSLPVDGRVALCAVASKAALVLVFVACNATGRKAQPCVIQILGPQLRSRGWKDVLGCMAGTARNTGVFPIERVTGLRVIKAPRGRVPMEQVEVFPVVIGVAFDAGRSGRSGVGKCRMESLVPLQFVFDFAMAFQTVKSRRPGRDLVAFDAIGGPVEALMRPGKGSRRNLRTSRTAEQHEDLQQETNSQSPARREKTVGHALASCSLVPWPVPGLNCLPHLAHLPFLSTNISL